MPVPQKKSLLEVQFLIGQLSLQSYLERDARTGKILNSLGKWWGTKPIVLTRAVILGSLFESSDDPDRWPEDLEVFLKLLCFDNAGMWKRRNEGLKEISSRPPWPRFVELCHPHARPDELDLFKEKENEDDEIRWRPRLDDDDLTRRETLEKRVFYTLGHEVQRRYCKRMEEVPPAAEAIAVEYATKNGFENVDYLLEQMVHRKESFNALVIIDELNGELENVLKEKFRFPVELLTLERFKSASGDVVYKFDPLLADVDSSDEGSKLPQLDPSELDTVVVPAQEEGFADTFIAEDRWHHIRMSAAMIPQIKWIATYRVAPISAITHLAKVAKIEPYKDSGKYELIFEGPAVELKKPTKLIPKSNVKALQAPRYTSHQRRVSAKDLNEAF